MKVTVPSVRWQSGIVYLYYIGVLSKLLLNYIEHARRILWLLNEAGVKLKLKKCKFRADTIASLGHNIRPVRLMLAERTTDSVAKSENPTTEMGLHSILSPWKVFMCFVQNFSCLVALFNKKFGSDYPETFGFLNKKGSAAVAS